MEKSILPIEFVDRLREKLDNEIDAFLDEHAQPSPVSVRINPFKSAEIFSNYEKVPWAEGAFYLPERISFTLDPLFHAGCYYVQEASSMYLEQALKIAFADGKPVRVLDLCAAPGGKSTHIASLLPEGSLLVSNEVISSRNVILQQNISKWGVSNVVITQNDVADFSRAEGFFDVIVVDAPCSGEGLFRKDAEAVNHWSVDNVAMCALRQENILNDIYDSLKQGGFLIYSTCTYEHAENEQQIHRMIQKYSMESIAIQTSFNGPVAKIDGTQFYPHLVKGEGFFISMLRKTEEANQISLSKFKSKTSKEVAEFFDSYLKEPENFIPLVKNNELYALPENIFVDINFLMNNFFVRKAGIHVGTLKGKDLVPSHELALSIALKTEVQKAELTREEAIRYLRCESVTVPGVPNGWTLVTYHNFPLGWIKIIGNRINNYFPRSLRILK